VGGDDDDDADDADDAADSADDVDVVDDEDDDDNSRACVMGFALLAPFARREESSIKSPPSVCDYAHEHTSRMFRFHKQTHRHIHTHAKKQAHSNKRRPSFTQPHINSQSYDTHIYAHTFGHF
jgi:monomeric isocitrate dehydrogenase